MSAPSPAPVTPRTQDDAIDALRQLLPTGHPGKTSDPANQVVTWPLAVKNLASNRYWTLNVSPQTPQILFCSGQDQEVWNFVFDSAHPDQGIKIQHAASGLWVVRWYWGTLQASGQSIDEADSFSTFTLSGGWGLSSQDQSLYYGGDNNSAPPWLILGLPNPAGSAYFTWISEWPGSPGDAL